MTTTISGHVVEKRIGNEGPAHDPYSWEEVIVNRHGHKYTFRFGGLGYTRVYKDDKILCDDFGPEGFISGMNYFAVETGLTPVQWERVERKLSERCSKCRSKRLGYVDGFPGEALLMCMDCEAIQRGSYFNDSSII